MFDFFLVRLVLSKVFILKIVNSKSGFFFEGLVGIIIYKCFFVVCFYLFNCVF